MKTRAGWVMLAAAVVLAAIAVTAVVTRTGQGEPDTNAGRLTQMEQTGELHDMLQEHQAMMERMRADASPQMLALMEADPMWQMLESGEMIRLMEEHQADIDEMLAR